MFRSLLVHLDDDVGTCASRRQPSQNLAAGRQAFTANHIELAQAHLHGSACRWIPGAKKDDIRVCVDGNLVSISAEVRNEWQEQEEGRVLVKERYYCSASRSFRLAADVDDKAAEAKFENGVLKLTLPKRAPAASKTLQIR